MLGEPNEKCNWRRVQYTVYVINPKNFRASLSGSNSCYRTDLILLRVKIPTHKISVVFSCFSRSKLNLHLLRISHGSISEGTNRRRTVESQNPISPSYSLRPWVLSSILLLSLYWSPLLLLLESGGVLLVWITWFSTVWRRGEGGWLFTLLNPKRGWLLGSTPLTHTLWHKSFCQSDFFVNLHKRKGDRGWL